MSMTRKQFLSALGTLVAGTTLASAALSACDDGDGDDSDDSSGGADAAPGTPDAAPGTPDAAPGSPDAAPMPDATPVSCTDNGTIVSNTGHTHAATVSKTDVVAGLEKTYPMGDNGGHAHSFTLTAAHFAMLQAGTMVTVTTTLTGHTHNVTVRCA